MQRLERIFSQGINSAKKNLGVLTLAMGLTLPTNSLAQAISLNNQGESSWDSANVATITETSQTGKKIGSQNVPVYYHGRLESNGEITIGYSLTKPGQKNSQDSPYTLNNTESRLWIVAPSCVEISVESQKATHYNKGEREIETEELVPMDKNLKARAIYKIGNSINEWIRENDPTKKISELPIANLFIKKGFVESIEDKLIEKDRKETEELSPEEDYSINLIPFWPSDNAQNVARVFSLKTKVTPGFTGKKIPVAIYQKTAIGQPFANVSGKLETIANLEIENPYAEEKGKLDGFIGAWEISSKIGESKKELMGYLALQKSSEGYAIKVIDPRQEKIDLGKIKYNTNGEIELVLEGDNRNGKMIFKQIPEQKILDYQTSLQEKSRKEEEIKEKVRKEYENITDEDTVREVQRRKIMESRSHSGEESIRSKLNDLRIKMRIVEESSKLAPEDKRRLLYELDKKINALNAQREREVK